MTRSSYLLKFIKEDTYYLLVASELHRAVIQLHRLDYRKEHQNHGGHLQMKLYIFKVGRINLKDKGHMTPGSGVNEPISIPVYCYLIEHEKGLVLLVDTGMWDMDPCSVKEGEDIVSQLEKLGYQAADVDFVVMTHLHIDHAAYMNAFPHAKFVVRRKELRAAWWPEPCEGGYLFAQYRETRDFQFLQPEDDEELDLFGDGSIRLIDTRGHSRGHQSVVLSLNHFGRIVLTGDAAALRENLDRCIQPGICTCNWDAISSLQKLKHMEEIGYTLFFGHDIVQEKELKLAPKYYE